VYVGHALLEKAEREIAKHFASDRATIDGFYGRCRKCVSRYQRATRDGRNCNPDALMTEQDNQCGICHKPITYHRGNGAKVTAYIDHNHETNAVRGLLCPRCNSLLRGVEDIEWLQNAMSYLRKYGWDFKCE